MAQGYYSFAKSGAAGPEEFDEIIRKNERLNDELRAKWVIQFHQGVHRQHLEVEDAVVKAGYVSGDDPNILASKVLGRKMDLNFGIFNPNCGRFYNPSLYDIVIANPDAREKKISF